MGGYSGYYIARNELARFLGAGLTVLDTSNPPLNAAHNYRAAMIHDPNRHFVTLGNSIQLRFDYGAGNTAKWRAIALINHNLTSAATVRVRASDTDVWGAPAFDSGVQTLHGGAAPPLDINGHLVLSGVDYRRWWRVDIQNTLAAPDPVRTWIGELWVGVKAFDRTVVPADEDLDANQPFVIDGFIEPRSGFVEDSVSVSMGSAVDVFDSDFMQPYRARRRPNRIRFGGEQVQFAAGALPLLNLSYARGGGRPFIFVPDRTRDECYYVRMEEDATTRTAETGGTAEKPLLSTGGWSFVQDTLIEPVNGGRPV